MGVYFRRDRYGVKTLRIGAERLIPDRSTKQCYNAVWKLHTRHPEFRHRQFDYRAVEGGVIIRRLS